MRIGLHLRLERASPDVPPDRANVATPLARLGFDPGVRLAEVRADADASVSLPRKEVALISTYVGHRNRRIDLVAWRHNYYTGQRCSSCGLPHHANLCCGGLETGSRSRAETEDTVAAGLG